MSTDNNIVIKAGAWYAISNILVRASSFITIPIFSRLLSQAQYGEYSNLSAWVTIFTILTGWDAYTSVIRSKHEFENDLDKYISSVYILNFSTTVLILLILVVSWPLSSKILSIKFDHLIIVFAYLFVLPAFNLYATKQRAYYKYKTYSVITVLNVLSSALLSVVFVIGMDDKLLGRVLGQYLPPTVIFLAIAVHLLLSGRGARLAYCKYAARLSLPFVPHLLSLNVLSVSARIIINMWCGKVMAALYSICFNCVQIGNILFDAINKAWAPWFMDAMFDGRKADVLRVSNLYFFAMSGLVGLIILLGPECILILGGEEYLNAIWALPPLLISCMFQVAYTMYINLEYYAKKTKVIAVATCTAASINLMIAVVAIPVFGYVAASFASYIGYAILYLIHYAYCHRSLPRVFDSKRINCVLCSSPGVIALAYGLYYFSFVRILIICVAIIACIIVLYFNRQVIVNLIKGSYEK